MRNILIYNLKKKFEEEKYYKYIRKNGFYDGINFIKTIRKNILKIEYENVTDGSIVFRIFFKNNLILIYQIIIAITYKIDKIKYDFRENGELIKYDWNTEKISIDEINNDIRLFIKEKHKEFNKEFRKHQTKGILLVL